MSRGPGRWQRVLLDALEQSPFIGVGGTVWAHLGRAATRSEEVAARRAAKRLVETGQARAIYRKLPRYGGGGDTHQLLLTRLDYLMPSDLVPINASSWVDTKGGHTISTRAQAAVLGVSQSTVVRDTRRARKR